MAVSWLDSKGTAKSTVVQDIHRRCDDRVRREDIHLRSGKTKGGDWVVIDNPLARAGY